MRGSCHLTGRPNDKIHASNLEIGVEYQKIFVEFFQFAVKCILGHLQDIEKVG